MSIPPQLVHLQFQLHLFLQAIKKALKLYSFIIMNIESLAYYWVIGNFLDNKLENSVEMGNAKSRVQLFFCTQYVITPKAYYNTYVFNDKYTARRGILKHEYKIERYNLKTNTSFYCYLNTYYSNFKLNYYKYDLYILYNLYPQIYLKYK